MSLRTLGKVAVTTAGTPVQVAGATSLNQMAKSVQFQANPGNTGKIYIGLSTLVKSTLVGVLAILPEPSDATKGPFTTQTFGDVLNPPKLTLSQFWIDSDVNGDSVIVSYIDER